VRAKYPDDQGTAKELGKEADIMRYKIMILEFEDVIFW